MSENPFDLATSVTDCLPVEVGSVRNAKGIAAKRHMQLNDLTDAWQDLRSKCLGFRSPYFSPAFCAALVEAGVAVEYMTQVQNGEIVGILPFQRKTQNSALPAGGGLNDAHGAIVKTGIDFDWRNLFAEHKVKSFAVHACPQLHPQFSEFSQTKPSFLADLSVDDSYEAFLARKHSTIARQGQKDRKLERTNGKFSFELDCRDPKKLDLLMAWKSSQYKRTYICDIFGFKWVRDLLHVLHRRPTTESLRGMLSVLSSGGTPVALHFGIAEGDLLHYWYPTYDPAFGYGSPGTRMFLQIAKKVKQEGIQQIDFGYGEQPYKHVLCNRMSSSALGLLSTSRIHQVSYETKMMVRRFGKSLWFKESVKPIVRSFFPSPEQEVFKINDSEC